MSFKAKFLVLGVRCFNDEVEGVRHNFTKVNVVMDMPDRKNANGQDCIAMNWGDATNFEKLSEVVFPMELELTINPTTKGMEVLDVLVPRKVTL